MWRLSSFRRWLRASTLVAVACVGSVLLFHDTETSAWDTANEDEQHDANSHDGDGWLSKGWHNIESYDEKCEAVLSSNGKIRNEDFDRVYIPHNFRVQNCIDYYECEIGVPTHRLSKWLENHRHGNTGTTGDHDPNYKVRLDGVNQGTNVTEDDLTCDDDDDHVETPPSRVCPPRTDYHGDRITLRPGETWDAEFIDDVCNVMECDKLTISGLRLRRGNLDHYGLFIEDYENGDTWQLDRRDGDLVRGCPGYESKGGVYELYTNGQLRSGEALGFNIYPDNYPYENENKTRLQSFTNPNIWRRKNARPINNHSNKLWEGLIPFSRHVSAHHSRDHGLRAVARGYINIVGFKKLYEAGVGSQSPSTASSHPVYEYLQRNFKWGWKWRSHTYITPRVQRMQYTVSSCVRRLSFENKEVVSCGSNKERIVGPWFCPSGGTDVHPSRIRRTIPQDISDDYNNATDSQREAKAQALYDWCRNAEFPPVVTIEVPDGYREGQTKVDEIEVTFTKQSGNGTCPTKTATYTPAAKRGDTATSSNVPTLDGACGYMVDYENPAADGDLELDPTAAGHDLEVTADDPATKATYIQAKFEPAAATTHAVVPTPTQVA